MLYLFIAVIVLKFIEVVGSFVILMAGLKKSHLFSVSPFEVFCVLLVESAYANKIIYVLRIVPAYCVLMVLLALFICWFTTMGEIVFSNVSAEHNGYFRTFGGSMWNMLVVLNGSNWPSPMIPAYYVSATAPCC